MARRKRSDSIAGQVAVAGALARPLVAPAHVSLEACDEPFFASVIEEFPRSEWTCHQLELAAMLARTMADTSREQLLLRSEGSVSTTERGTPVVNPRKAVLQMHAATILSFRRSLSLHAAGMKGQAKDNVRRLSDAMATEAALLEEGEGLLN